MVNDRAAVATAKNPPPKRFNDIAPALGIEKKTYKTIVSSPVKVPAASVRSMSFVLRVSEDTFGSGSIALDVAGISFNVPRMLVPEEGGGSAGDVIWSFFELCAGKGGGRTSTHTERATSPESFSASRVPLFRMAKSQMAWREIAANVHRLDFSSRFRPPVLARSSLSPEPIRSVTRAVNRTKPIWTPPSFRVA